MSGIEDLSTRLNYRGGEKQVPRMNEDKLPPYARCASTSNRNFEGRQGYLSRTHLCSPRTATIIAIFGKIDLDFIKSFDL